MSCHTPEPATERNIDDAKRFLEGVLFASLGWLAVIGLVLIFGGRGV